MSILPFMIDISLAPILFRPLQIRTFISKSRGGARIDYFSSNLELVSSRKAMSSAETLMPEMAEPDMALIIFSIELQLSFWVITYFLLEPPCPCIRLI